MRMAHRWLFSLGAIAVVLGLAYSPATAAPHTDHKPTNPLLEHDPPAESPFDIDAERNKLVASAWEYLGTMYNQRAPRDDRAGIQSGWGPESLNIPYTAMILQALVGTPHWDPEDERIKDSVDFVLENQETTGAWSYMPVTVMPQARGQRAVYITSIAAQLMVDLNGMEGPWRGRLNNQIALARDYLRTSQVGAEGGPLEDYDEDKAGFGGWAYSREELDQGRADTRPSANMSTTSYAIDALKACGLDEDDPVWERALRFLKRSQNAGEVQDEGWEAIDRASGRRIRPAEPGSRDFGGAIYSDDTSYAEGGIEHEDGTITLFSYGSMTYNLLRAYLFAGLERDSIPVRLAWGWIQRNYTVERVPGHRNPDHFDMGLFYYYMSMSKTLSVWGEDYVEEPERGTRYNWREDIVKALKERQKDDGNWVNENHSRWQENSPVLCTAYSLLALRHTRE
jgi:hypothetical protein